MSEIEWRPIPGTNARYEVSTDGQVRRKRHYDRRSKEWSYRYLEGRRNRAVPCVVITYHGKAHEFSIKRIVAMAFHGTPKNFDKKTYPAVINGNEYDLRPENVHWVEQRAYTQRTQAEPIFDCDEEVSAVPEKSEGIIAGGFSMLPVVNRPKFKASNAEFSFKPLTEEEFIESIGTLHRNGRYSAYKNLIVDFWASDAQYAIVKAKNIKAKPSSIVRSFNDTKREMGGKYASVHAVLRGSDVYLSKVPK